MDHRLVSLLQIGRCSFNGVFSVERMEYEETSFDYLSNILNVKNDSIFIKSSLRFFPDFKLESRGK